MIGSLSPTEILFILVIALIIFGPRKLPELGRSLGQGLAQFRKASEDFKRSWEEDIRVEEKRMSASVTSVESSVPVEPKNPPEPKSEESESRESQS
jgi:TatA/E family protein of Tat protein translocase